MPFKQPFCHFDAIENAEIGFAGNVNMDKQMAAPDLQGKVSLIKW